MKYATYKFKLKYATSVIMTPRDINYINQKITPNCKYKNMWNNSTISRKWDSQICKVFKLTYEFWCIMELSTWQFFEFNIKSNNWKQFSWLKI